MDVLRRGHLICRRSFRSCSSRSSPSSPTLKWIWRAVVAVILLYIALNLASRDPSGERLLTQPLGAAGSWQVLVASSPSSPVSDDPNTAAASPGASSSLLLGRGQGARPAEFEQCGRWQEAYVERHRRILAGELPERYLVAVLHDAGVADQLLGVVTAFYWALLTDRAFQITAGHQRLPPLEAAFDAPFINWTRPLDPRELTEHLYFGYGAGDLEGRADGGDEPDSQQRAYPTDGSVDTERFASIYLSNNNIRNDALFRHADLRTVFAEQAVVFTASNRGRTYRLFDNPYHRRALAEMGLRPETAFGCAFRFLFKPNAAVLQTEAMRLLQTALRPSSNVWKDGREIHQEVVRIGIQIRAGDWTFDKELEQELRLNAYLPFFDCARQIEAFAAKEGKLVLWYLISDSALLRKKALKRFGPEKVVTSTQDHNHVACNVVDCGGRDQAQALVEAMGDLISLSKTDYKVLTQKSGFGKVAASLAVDNWHGTYWPDLPIGKGSFHNANEPRQMLVEAMGDLISLSKTDYKVLTQKSGFGKVAASLAVDNWHGTYWPDLPIGKGSFHNANEPRQIVSTVNTCHQADYLLLEDLSDGWSGVR